MIASVRCAGRHHHALAHVRLCNGGSAVTVMNALVRIARVHRLEVSLNTAVLALERSTRIVDLHMIRAPQFATDIARRIRPIDRLPFDRRHPAVCLVMKFDVLPQGDLRRERLGASEFATEHSSNSSAVESPTADRPPFRVHLPVVQVQCDERLVVRPRASLLAGERSAGGVVRLPMIVAIRPSTDCADLVPLLM